MIKGLQDFLYPNLFPIPRDGLLWSCSKYKQKHLSHSSTFQVLTWRDQRILETWGRDTNSLFTLCLWLPFINMYQILSKNLDFKRLSLLLDRDMAQSTSSKSHYLDSQSAYQSTPALNEVRRYRRVSSFHWLVIWFPWFQSIGLPLNHNFLNLCRHTICRGGLMFLWKLTASETRGNAGVLLKTPPPRGWVTTESVRGW